MDAQIAYDASRGLIRLSETAEGALPMRYWLMADVNGDMHLDATDAFAIQSAAIRGWK